MTPRFDPEREELVVSMLRKANPVPRGEIRHSPEQVTAFLLEVTERTDMVQHITAPVEQTPERGGDPAGWKRRHWVGFAAGFALALLIALPVLLLGLNDGQPEIADPALNGLTSHQAQIVAKAVDAINEERFDDFRALFAADGSVGFEQGLLMPYHVGVESGQPISVTDTAGFEADFIWSATLDRRADLIDCVSQTERIFDCDVVVTWEPLRIETVQNWGFALDESGRLRLLVTEPNHSEPAGRSQPLDVTDLHDVEVWMEENRPEEYRRLIRPQTPFEINDVEIVSPFSPDNPDLIDEMTVLIDEYLASR